MLLPPKANLSAKKSYKKSFIIIFSVGSIKMIIKLLIKVVTLHIRFVLVTVWELSF